ncbi:MAG: amidase [Methylobacteriaceae bacterium]|nr:amidase [Methylobacteriaceae bacterium]
MTDLADLCVAELARVYASGAASPVEATRAVLTRIERLEPKLCALWALDADAALAAAAQSERRWRAGAPLGPLDGVAATIKENIATEGVAVPLGCAASALTPAAADAPPAARLREAGAVILAKTTMPDLGMLSSGLSSFHKLARNPWDAAKNPGGSSSGAGAAAAAGYGPLHVGTDIGGSIRLPAGWCGVVGLKPSFGRIPIDPPFIGRVAGPMTRTVDDAAAMMAALSKPDARDAISLPPTDLDWAITPARAKGLKLGLWLDPGYGLPLDGETRAAIEAAARAFAAEGAIVEPVGPFLTREMINGLDRFWRARAWSDIGAWPAERRAKVLPYILQWAERGTSYDGMSVYRGFAQIGAMRDAALRASAPFDYLISPTAPVAAFPAELASPNHDPQAPFEHIAYTVAFNMSEQPAVSVNAGYTRAGLPIGLQIAGPRFDDIGVLRVAKLWEAIRPAQKPWPTT